MSTSTIPASVLVLLKHRWNSGPDQSRSFETVRRDRPDRFNRPCWYFIHPGAKAEDSSSLMYSYPEAKALVQAGAFGPHAHMSERDVAVINEHAQHAFSDFCCEVYASWEKYQDRLQQISQVTFREDAA